MAMVISLVPLQNDSLYNRSKEAPLRILSLTLSFWYSQYFIIQHSLCYMYWVHVYHGRLGCIFVSSWTFIFTLVVHLYSILQLLM